MSDMESGAVEMKDGNHDFYGLGIAPQIIDILGRLKFVTPTPIQHKVLPTALEGKDIIGIAQTGTGKTLAFAIPITQHLSNNKGRALILVPTRELALQVEQHISQISNKLKIRTVSLIGGAPIHKQIWALSKNPRIIIATPGRLIDLLKQRKLHLKDICILVLDEADRMLDMGFAPQIDEILKTLPAKRQTLFFSATMPGSIVKMISTYMKIPVQIEVAPAGTAAEGVTHELFIVKRDKKKELLKKLLAQYRGSVLLFCRTKSATSRTAHAISAMGHRAAAIHSDRSLGQRREALEGFRSGRYRVLAATDIAARGIDVRGIELVINYDLPDDAENYIHRIGRTGRAGGTGHAISFAAPDQKSDVFKIERLLKAVIPISTHPDIPAEKFNKPQPLYSFSRTGGRRRMPPGRRKR